MKNASWRRAANPVLCVTAVAVAMVLGWGFTVDDALISTRVAHHLDAGLGHRFNASGDPVDCVTPLGWAHLLARFSSTPWQGLEAARWLGVLSCLCAAGFVGVRCRDVPVARWVAVALPLALCLPLGAWASSGMETGCVTLLVTLCLLPGRIGLGFASLAAGLRPELIPFALCLGWTRTAAGPKQRLSNVVLVLACPLAVGVLRGAWFGHPAPLSVFAKPTDLDSGLYYALGAVVGLGLPVLLVATTSYRKVTPEVRSLALALGVHTASVAVAGGDWMALYRLFIPVIPIIVFVAAQLSQYGALRASLARAAVASLVLLNLLRTHGASTRSVLDTRLRLSRELVPLLVDARSVATLDVGWVGASTGATIVDLAGVTDLEVALLPGGHTSKRLPMDFLVRRAPDTMVLLLAQGIDKERVARVHWTELQFARIVEQRLARMEGAHEFVPIALLDLSGNQRYLVVRRLTQRFASL